MNTNHSTAFKTWQIQVTSKTFFLEAILQKHLKHLNPNIPNVWWVSQSFSHRYISRPTTSPESKQPWWSQQRLQCHIGLSASATVHSWRLENVQCIPTKEILLLLQKEGDMEGERVGRGWRKSGRQRHTKKPKKRNGDIERPHSAFNKPLKVV